MIERMDQLSQDIQLLSSSLVARDQVERYRTRVEELSNLSQGLMVPTKLVELFRQKSMKFLVPGTEAQELRTLLDELIAMYEADHQSILSPDRTWRYSTRNRLGELAQQINENLSVAWRVYLEQLRPTVDQVPLHLLQNAPAYASRAGEIRELLSQFERLAQRLPVNLEEIERPERLAERLRSLTQDIPAEIPPSVRELFESINTGTANAAQLTDEVIQWLRVNNLLATLHISWRRI